MADVATNGLSAIDTLDALIRYSIGIIRCSEKKRPDELTINDILHK